MNPKRPVNLDLTTMKLPVMAIASILHRLSGVVLFLLLPAMLYFLAVSLRSAESFVHVQQLFTVPYYQLLLWVFCAALVYHILAGIRHMIMDLGYGEGLQAGRSSATAVIVLAIILTIFLGFWIW